MNRFVNTPLGDVVAINYTPYEVVYEESCVDKTHFMPTVNNVRNCLNAGTAGDVSQGQYLFADGKDNGVRLGSIAELNPDIVDLHDDMQALQEDAALKESMLKAEFENQVQQSLKQKIDKPSEPTQTTSSSE